MTTASAIDSIGRRFARVIRTVVLIFIFFPAVLTVLFSQGFFFSPQSVRTDAVVLKVADTRPTAQGERRVRVTFEYLAEGRSHVRTRRVRTSRVVNIGDRISVQYRKNRPERANVVSMQPPELTPVPVVRQRSGGNGSDGFVESWLIWLVALPFIAWGGYMFFKGGAGAPDGKRPAAKASNARQTAAEPQAAGPQATRGPRPERQRDETYEQRRERKRRIAAAMPQRKSKVVQRASWF